MKVSELTVRLEMKWWQRVHFYVVNIPRAMLGKSIVVYPSMISLKILK